MKNMIAKIRGLVDAKLIKFLAVGVVNTVIGTGLMFGFYNLFNMSYWVSSALSYVIASVISFFLNKYFTFKSTARGFKEIVVFAANIAVCYLLAYGLAKPAVRILFSGLTPKAADNVSMLVGMVLFTGFNYLGQRLIVFRKSDEATVKGDKDGEE